MFAIHNFAIFVSKTGMVILINRTTKIKIFFVSYLLITYILCPFFTRWVNWCLMWTCINTVYVYGEIYENSLEGINNIIVSIVEGLHHNYVNMDLWLANFEFAQFADFVLFVVKLHTEKFITLVYFIFKLKLFLIKTYLIYIYKHLLVLFIKLSSLFLVKGLFIFLLIIFFINIILEFSKNYFFFKKARINFNFNQINSYVYAAVDGEIVNYLGKKNLFLLKIKKNLIRKYKKRFKK